MAPQEVEVDNLEEPKEIDKAETLITFEGTKRFKSVSRAMRRGLVHTDGTVYPKRPFNNRKGRQLNNVKKQVYEQLREYNNREIN